MVKRMESHCGSKTCASCVQIENLIFITHHTGDYNSTDITSQTHTAIQNIEKTLKNVGSKWEDIVQLHYYLSDKNDYRLGAKVFEEYFSGNPIARTTMITEFIDERCLCQIDGIAYKQ